MPKIRSSASEHVDPSPSDKKMVKWKDVLTGQWNGPDLIVSWTRGAVCVFPQESGRPERLVRPIILREERKPITEPLHTRDQDK